MSRFYLALNGIVLAGAIFCFSSGAEAATLNELLKDWRSGLDLECTQIPSRNSIEEMATNGDVDAQVYLGWAYFKGTKCGIKIDELASKSWVKKAAEQGDPEAQLAMAYYLNHGVKLDLSETLGTSGDYDIGGKANSVGKDESKSYEWAFRAAKQKYAPAVSIVGKYYQRGIGVPRNAGEAFNLHITAGLLGYTEGYAAAGGMLFESTRSAYVMKQEKVFDQSAVLSLMYFILSKEVSTAPKMRLPHESVVNENYQANALKSLDDWMTAEQKKRAATDAREFLASNGK